MTENPVGSLLWHYQPLRRLLKDRERVARTHTCPQCTHAAMNALQDVEAITVSVPLGRWGSGSLKPVTLSGTAPWLRNIGTATPLWTAKQMQKANGWIRKQVVKKGPKGDVTGGKDLTASGQYPGGFAMEAA